MALSAFGCIMRLSTGCAAIDRYLQPAGPTAANMLLHTRFAAVGPRWNRQMER